MNNNDDDNDVIIPAEMAKLEWVWVLTSPLNKNMETIFILEIEDRLDFHKRRILPIFETKHDAAKVKVKLLHGKAGQYSEHAINLSEVGKVAAQNEAEIMMLDEEGNIMAHMEAHIEQPSLH